MLEGVTIEQLRTLRAVAEAGSFSAAARKLGRVQAAVSQSIERLEAQLKLQLFDRSGRIPKLTPHGDAVLKAATRIEGEVDALDEMVQALRRGKDTELTIVVDAMFPASALVSFARDFAREHPSVALVLFTELLSAVTALVRDKRATLGIAGDDADLNDLERQRIATIHIVPVAAPSHPLAKLEGTLDSASLSRAVQIVLSERQREGDRVSPDRGVFSPQTWRVVDLATKHALIAGGLGWGLMPEHLVRADLRAGHLVALPLDAWGAESPQRGLWLVRRKGAAHGTVARWAEARLVELCRAAVDPAKRPGRHVM